MAQTVGEGASGTNRSPAKGVPKYKNGLTVHRAKGTTPRKKVVKRNEGRLITAPPTKGVKMPKPSFTPLPNVGRDIVTKPGGVFVPKPGGGYINMPQPTRGRKPPVAYSTKRK